MKKLIVSVLMLTAAGFAFAEADAKAGEAKTAVCAGCHGPNGNSLVASFPKLAGQHPKYISKQLTDMKEGNRNVVMMAAFTATLTDQDISDIAAYYGSQTISGGTTKAELAKKGESVFRGGNKEKGLAACTGCHSPDGKGNKGAGFPALAGQHADYLEAQLKAFRLAAEEPDAEGSRKNDGDTRMMRDVASRLSDLEIRAVSSFISGLR